MTLIKLKQVLFAIILTLYLSEAKTTDDILDSELYIENYSILQCNSTSRHTGGVVIYIKRNICTTEFRTFIHENNF